MNIFNIKYSLIGLAMAAMACTTGPRDGEYSFELLTTNDVHGSYFDSSYVGNRVRKSLYAVKYIVDSIRTSAGKDNVLLIDAGDILQGDNSAYYFNYVDTLEPHVYPRMAAYMDYDAVTVGNHDIETGHSVYDRVARELAAYRIPFLGGNAIRTDNGRSYFPLYAVCERCGVKIAVLGYTNANIKEWLSEDLWSGMEFRRLSDVVQNDVDYVIRQEKPQIVIISCHTATGAGDGKVLESEGLDLFKSLRGVDFLICSHDHKPFVTSNDSIGLINSGSHCRYVGDGKIKIRVEGGKVVSKEISVGLIPVDGHKIDTAMAAKFHEDYVKVKDFTNTKVGSSDCNLVTRDAFAGMCDYLNLLHAISLSCPSAQISIAAPLSYDRKIPAGELVYNDLFTIYPFENQLFVVRLTGSQIKDYLEASYGRWIQTMPSEHLLNIRPFDDARTGQKGWSFAERFYNFDSAGGIDYEVDVTKPKGERVRIISMADGTAFKPEETYSVAMTSYRANGGGGLLSEAGINPDSVEVVARYKEIRDMIYDYLKTEGSIRHEAISDPKVIGSWKFVPEKMASKAISKDLGLLFKN